MQGKRLFGLIGYPLSHSFSEKFFAEKFKNEGIQDAEYKPFPIENISQLPGLLKINPHLCGLNVTIPHKVSVIPFLDKLDAGAEKVGAVNTIRISPKGELKGYNTDIIGFTESLKAHPFYSQLNKKALLLGWGGAALAVAAGLKVLGFDYTIVSRRNLPESLRSICWPDLEENIVLHNSLIVNTTPLGMFPAIDDAPPIPYNAIGKSHLLFDLVYNPPLTRFLELGSANGAQILNGSQMLELQALAAWEIWNRGE